MSSATDKAKLRGIFSMRVLDRSGNVLEEYEDNNMIVNGAKQAMSFLVSDASQAANKVVTRIGFGTDTTEAQPEDEALGNEIPPVDVPEGQTVASVRKQLTGHSYPSTDRVQFNWALAPAEGNGSDICEFGLFTEDGTLFAHKVRSGVVHKDDSMSFEGTWTILF